MKKVFQIGALFLFLSNSFKPVGNIQSPETDAFISDFYTEEQTVDEIFLEAVVAHGSKDYEKAVDLYWQVIDLDPGMYMAYRGFGNAYYEWGKPHLAIQKLKPLTTTSNACALYGIGNVYYRVSQYEDATYYFEKAVEIDPDLAIAFNAMGIIFGFFGDHEKEESLYRHAISLDPTLYYPRKNISILYTEGQKAIDVIEKYSSILEENPDHEHVDEFLFLIGYGYVRITEFDRATEYFQRVISKYPESIFAEEAFYLIADLQFQQGRIIDSINTLDALLNSYPESVMSFNIFWLYGEAFFHEDDLVNGIGMIRDAFVKYAPLGIAQWGEEVISTIYQKDYLQKKNELDSASSEVDLVFTDETPYWVTLVDSFLLEDDFSGAIEMLEEVRLSFRENNDLKGEAGILEGIGRLKEELEDFQGAIDTFKENLFIRRILGDVEGEIDTLNAIGSIYLTLRDFPKAINWILEAYELCNSSCDRMSEATSLMGIIKSYMSMENYLQAEPFVIEAMDGSEYFIEDQWFRGETYRFYGKIKKIRGEYQEALKYLYLALKDCEEVGHRFCVGDTYNEIGIIYTTLGLGEDAYSNYQEALLVMREIGKELSESGVLSNIAQLYHFSGAYEQAVTNFLRALEIQRNYNAMAMERDTLNNLGAVYVDLGQYEQALFYYFQSLDLADQLENRIGEEDTLQNIGNAYLYLGDYENAESYFNSALPIAQKSKNKLTESRILGNIGYIYEMQGDYKSAISNYKQSIEIRESIANLIGISELKASFIGQQFLIYARLIQLLQNESRNIEAYQYIEKAHASVYIDQLSRADVQFREDSGYDLIEKESVLNSQILILNSQLNTLLGYTPSSQRNTEIDVVKRKIQELETQYSQLLARIKTTSLETYSLYVDEPTTIEDVQDMLVPNTTLIEYFVTDEEIIIYVIDKSGFETVVVDVGREKLQDEIDRFRDFPNLDTPQYEPMNTLYRWLIAPLVDFLDSSNLIIVPHNVLNYLPFGVLYDGDHYFIDQYSISVLPSANVLRFINDDQKTYSRRILGLGNPQTNLQPLRYSEIEVETITGLFGESPSIGENATESLFLSQSGNSNIVHLAAHGVYNEWNPLFSAILLSAADNSDGRLEVRDIYGLDLSSSTDLVVLSACQTNIGNISPGDEIVGLTRAFLYAGTPTVVSSLWNVDDQSTAYLMERFYSYMLDGESKIDSLRQAQIDTRERYPHPYYWAAFVLVGDGDGTIDFADNSLATDENPANNLWITYCLLGVGLSLVFIVKIRSHRKRPRIV